MGVSGWRGGITDGPLLRAAKALAPIMDNDRRLSDRSFIVIKLRCEEIWTEVFGDMSARGKIRRVTRSRYVLDLLVGNV